MSRTPPQTWQADSALDWLLKEGRFLAGLDDIVQGLGDKLLAAGAPLWRLRVSMRTLHPLVTAITAIWERDQGETTQRVSTHGLERRTEYIGSPSEIIKRSGKPFRKRLNENLSVEDHAVLHQLKERGATDYLGLPLALSNLLSAHVIVTTDTPSGFADSDIANFEHIAAVLAPIVETINANRTAIAVAEAYLGPRTGRRVLSGQITRGDLEAIDAAILLSDIRDWTGLNQRASPTEALALANRYFDVITDAVEAHEGEILKFLGDGVLAIFPTSDDVGDRSACASALGAARLALRTAQTFETPVELAFGIGLHFGQVLYGNVGSKSRLDFTVMGSAVNLTARIEGLCGKLGHSILFSQDVANRLSEASQLISEEHVKGFDAPCQIHTTI
ncbi:MAG: adenylate/guanylate cyclase domain-containing protein [Pseudomonadota bacterium]